MEYIIHLAWDDEAAVEAERAAAEPHFLRSDTQTITEGEDPKWKKTARN